MKEPPLTLRKKEKKTIPLRLKLLVNLALRVVADNSGVDEAAEI
jgi:hypothetical protein